MALSSAKLISNKFTWKEGVSSQDKTFVSLVDGKLVISTNPVDVLGITIDDNKNGKSNVGLIGIMNVRDDGSCIPGKKCTVLNGIATTGNKWFVLDRINDKTIKILFR